MTSEDLNHVVIYLPETHELTLEQMNGLFRFEGFPGFVDEIEEKNTVTVNLDDDETVHFLYWCVALYYDTRIDFSEFVVDFNHEGYNHLYLSEINRCLVKRDKRNEKTIIQLVDQVNLLTKTLDALQQDMSRAGTDRFEEIISVIINKLEQNDIQVRDAINEACGYTLQ